MKIEWSTGAVVLAAIALPMIARATNPQSGEEINVYNVRQAEAKAKSAEDHRKIAQYYQSQIKLIRVKLAEAEDLMNYWGSNTSMLQNNTVPNPYWSARSRAESLRLEVESASRSAAEQQKLVESVPQTHSGASSFQ